VSLKLSDLAKSMVGAAKGSLAEDWPKVKDFAKPEFEKLAKAVVDIAKLGPAGKINEQQAKALLAIHRNTTLTVLLTIEGMGLIAVENAINAALGAVRDAINSAAGFVIL
jgi:hypothetical protein